MSSLCESEARASRRARAPRVIAGCRAHGPRPGQARSRPVRVRVREHPRSSAAAGGARSLLGERDRVASEYGYESAPGHRRSVRASGRSRAARVWSVAARAAARATRPGPGGRGPPDLDHALAAAWPRYPCARTGDLGGVAEAPGISTCRSPRCDRGTRDLDRALAGAWPTHLVPGQSCRVTPAGRCSTCAGRACRASRGFWQRARRPVRAARGVPAAGAPSLPGLVRPAACAPPGHAGATRCDSLVIPCNGLSRGLAISRLSCTERESGRGWSMAQRDR